MVEMLWRFLDGELHHFNRRRPDHVAPLVAYFAPNLCDFTGFGKPDASSQLNIMTVLVFNLLTRKEGH